MKGTKLWNAPRSPLIRGRSKRESPFANDWLGGTIIGFAVTAILAAYFFADKGASATSIAQVLAPALIGSMVGAVIGVRAATGFGWRPRWAGGAALGVLFGLLGVVIFVGAGIRFFGV